MSMVNRNTRFVHDRNMIQCAPIVNVEQETVEVLAFCHVFDCVMIILVPLMKGRPIIVLTETFGQS